MKKILYGVASLSLAVALVAAGSSAFFFDQINSFGNSFTAGTINLTLWSWYDTAANGENGGTAEAPVLHEGTEALFELDDLKPGDFGDVNFRAVVTSNPAFMCGYVGLEDGTSDELAGMIDVYLSAFGDETDVTKINNASYVNQWHNLTGNVEFPPNINGDFTLHYCFGNFDENYVCNPDENVNYNSVQGDVVSATLSLYAEQSRNNEEFSCEGLNPPQLEVDEG